MTTATSPPGGNPARKVRITRLRRRYESRFTGFAPTDFVTAAWDDTKREWTLLVESANGLLIEHKLLTPRSNAA